MFNNIRDDELTSKKGGVQVKVQIMGMGHALPDRILGNKELEQMVDTDERWIIERTGIRERRIADPGTATSDLAYQAAVMALQRAGMEAEELDLIIIATASPDMLFPATACLVQEKIGAKHAAAFDIIAGCTGFIYALSVAEKMLLASEYKTALVIGAETLSRFTDYTDRNTCVLFGDGAGAAVLGKADSEKGILTTYLGSDGSGAEHLCMPAGGSALPASIQTVEDRLHYIKMNGKEIFRFATRITVELSDKILAREGMGYQDVDLFIPHQSNLRIIKTAMKWMNMSEDRTIINVDQFGNMSSACLPVALSIAEGEGRLKPGAIILMVAFGAGLTYGGVLLRWGRSQSSDV